jgi:GTP-binding protein
MFLDEAHIHISSGKGGDGAVHFRREKYVPHGGPDGGNGGRGGHVYLEVSPTLNTLSSFRHQTHFHAQDGQAGARSDRTGKEGEDLILLVPPGTVVRDDDRQELVGDLTAAGQRMQICRGGRGGRGNARFANSRNQAPRVAERGEPLQERHLHLELRLIADIGIIGVPNAGKSTFLAAVTNARPKIAEYPFTTLEPNLGVAEPGEGRGLVLADIPGLLEGAHAGVGLGTAFLRHIQRTRALIHLVDGSAPDPVADFSQVNAELALFDEHLKDRPMVLGVNKIDLPEVVARRPALEEAFTRLGYRPLFLSALARNGVREVLQEAERKMLAVQQLPVESAMPVYRPEPDPSDYSLSRDPDGTWRITGEAIERAAKMTYWEYDEAVRRFQRLLSRLGVEAALREVGVRAGDSVRIGEFELEWQD